MSMAAIRGRLAAGKVVFLDGAIGTELQKHGAPMDDDAWCALATESHPDVLREIHEDYIGAGADIITANTFSSSRTLLGLSGRADRAAPLSRRAIEIALEARERASHGRPVAIAGSISQMVPMATGPRPVIRRGCRARRRSARASESSRPCLPRPAAISSSWR